MESPVVKRFLVAATVLGTSLCVVGAGAVLGVTLGTRTLVVSAASVKPAAIGIASAGHLGSAPAMVAMGE
jgi:hypothetical protein